MNTTAIAITAIICATLVIICERNRGRGGKK
jgi:hypothetical protein